MNKTEATINHKFIIAFKGYENWAEQPKGNIMNDAAASHEPCTISPGCHACDRTFETCLSWDNLINAVALRIRQTLELGAVLQTTVDEVHRLLECDRVLIYQVEPDWSGRVVVESVSEPRWSVIDRVVHDPCFAASWLEPYKEQRYFAVEDVATANLTPCHAEYLASFQVQANLVIPILKEDALWGLLIAHHCQAPRSWWAVEIEGLQLLAVQVGIAIHQAALIDQLQTAKSTLEAEVAARTQELAQANQSLREVNQKLITKIRERNQVAAEVIQREAFLQQVLDSLFAFVGVMTPDGILIEANQAPLEIAGLSRDDVIGKPFVEAYWWAYAPEAQAAIQAAIETANQGTLARFDMPLQMQGGQLITIDFALTPLWDPRTGQITHLIPSAVDISDRLQAETERTRLLTVLEASLVAAVPVGIFRADATGQCTYTNERWDAMTGINPEQALGSGWAESIHPDDREQVFNAWTTATQTQQRFEIDVDHFKSFNDAHGHDAGDVILKAIAQTLKDHIRGSDIACRYGGEELTLVLSETALMDALARAEEIREAIHRITMTYGDQTLDNLTASFGVAVFPEHGTTGSEVIQAADAALYRAKGAGRNQVVAAKGSLR